MARKKNRRPKCPENEQKIMKMPYIREYKANENANSIPILGSFVPFVDYFCY